MPKKGERTWTDDQLRDAVASSTTYVEAMAKLGLSPRGRNHRNIQERIQLLGIDASHFAYAQRSFTDKQLRELVPLCTSYIQVTERLGLDRTDTTATRVQRRITILGISTAHFLRTRKAAGRRTRWTDDELRAAVAMSRGYASTIRALGLIPAGGNYDHVQRRIKELALDTSHFKSMGWSKGMKVDRGSRPLEEVLVANRLTPSHKLKRRLIRAGLKKAACELCGWAERRPSEGVIPVELDHSNGDKTDNRIENLRVLCPNCHALQPTHRGLNQKRRRL